MNFERFRNVWRNNGPIFNNLCNYEYLNDFQNNNQRRTVLESLIEKYKRFSRLGILFALMFLLYTIAGTLPGLWGRIISGIMMIMMLVGAFTDYLLYNKLNSINLNQWGVGKVNETIITCKRIHIRYVIIMLPLSLGVIGILMYISRELPYLLYGEILGLILGLLIGIRNLITFIKQYSYLQDEKQ